MSLTVELRRTEKVTVRFRPHERKVMEAAAREAKELPSEFIRGVVMASAHRRLGRRTED